MEWIVNCRKKYVYLDENLNLLFLARCPEAYSLIEAMAVLIRKRLLGRQISCSMTDKMSSSSHSVVGCALWAAGVSPIDVIITIDK